MGVSTQEGALIVTASSRGNVETKCGMTLELANVNRHENFRTSTCGRTRFELDECANQEERRQALRSTTLWA